MATRKTPTDLLNHLIPAMGHRATAQWMHDTFFASQRSDKLITSAEVLALNTTAIEIVPAPGANKYLQLDVCVVFLDYNAAAYVDDAGEDLVVTWTDKNGAEVSHTSDGSIWDGTADTLAYLYPLNAAASTLEPVVNSPLCLFLKTGNWITGDSPLKVRTYYRVHDIADLARIT